MNHLPWPARFCPGDPENPGASTAWKTVKGNVTAGRYAEESFWSREERGCPEIHSVERLLPSGGQEEKYKCMC